MNDGPLKIAIFSDSYLPVLNGVSISVDALVNALRERGHSVHIFTSRFPNYQDATPNVYRFRAVETPWTKGYPLAFPPFYRILRKFRRNEFDVIQTHTPWTVGFVGLRWAESHEIPIVSTYHTLYDRYLHYLPFFPRRYLRFRIAKHTNFYYNRVDQVITPSEAAAKWLRRHSVHSPITVVPTGAPKPRPISRAEARVSLGMAPEHKVMLYVGRLAQEKNVETLFHMAAIAFAQDPGLRLWLVGDGPHRSACAELARRLGIGDRVRFVGFVGRSEVDRYYAAADLFVFASITETQGLVIQESMSYGLPAVAVAGGGASEGIESGVNGIIARNDPAALAEAALSIFSDDLLASRLSAAALKSVHRLGEADMGDRVVDVYRKAIRQRAGQAREGASLVSFH